MSEATDSPSAQQEVAEEHAETAGATPLPVDAERQTTEVTMESEDREEQESRQDPPEASPAQADELPAPGQTAPRPDPPVTAESKPDDLQQQESFSTGAVGYSAGAGVGQYRAGVQDTSSGQHNVPLTINQLAIVASAQNKLPVSKVKGIVLRVGRHTESSLQKSTKWYKNENYVDKNTYSWKNMPLFEEYQRHLWTPAGTVRDTYKK